jgi:hypothetical protein
VHTDSDGFDLDTFLNVGAGSVVGALVGEDSLAAERVDEGRTAWRAVVSHEPFGRVVDLG